MPFTFFFFCSSSILLGEGNGKPVEAAAEDTDGHRGAAPITMMYCTALQHKRFPSLHLCARMAKCPQDPHLQCVVHPDSQLG